MSDREPAPARRTEVVVIGGGQAGLSTSWHLTRAGVDHVVLEARTAGHEWADRRWDAFTLVTPNWHCRLPGYAYDGPDPDGFMTRDEVVAWLGGYAATFDPPLVEQTTATSLVRSTDGSLEVAVTGPDGAERWLADHVVVATGGYHQPIVPRWAPALDPAITQLHSADYLEPDQLPDGDVLVVGTGQSGTQIAEDLHLAGRSVHLALGDAPRVARTYRGRDSMTWLADMGVYDKPVETLTPMAASQEKTNHYVTGRDGGRDIDLRQFAQEGMRLYGLLDDLEEPGTARLRFRATLTQSLDHADSVYNSICGDIDRWIESQGIDAPPPTRYEPVWRPDHEPTSLDLHAAGITSVVWAIGYRPDYSWMRADVFDGVGRPMHHRGETSVPGLYFLGLPWLHTWGSGRFLGIAQDAAHVVDRIRDTRSGGSMGARTGAASVRDVAVAG